MDKKNIEIGGEYAFRDPPKPGVEFQRVKVLELVRSKWRVRWIEPNEGLEDFVKSSSLIVPWKERQPYLRDEQRRLALARQCDRTWRGHNDPTCSAVTTVFDTTGERWIGIDNDGSLYADPEALQRLCDRIGVQVPHDEQYGYTDRFGRVHEPYELGYRLAVAFAQAEPQTVLLDIDTQQRRWEIDARDPANSYLVDLLRDFRAEFAIIRQWAGHDKAVAMREAEIERLTGLVRQAIWKLRSEQSGESVATWLERNIARH
jgi:hypothetical protein